MNGGDKENSFTRGLVSNVVKQKSVNSEFCPDYNGYVVHFNKIRPVETFLLDIESHDGNLVSKILVNNSYVPLSAIFLRLIEACSKKKYLTSKDVYFCISKLAKYNSDALSLITIGIISQIDTGASTSCPQKCRSLIVHCKEDYQVGIMVFFKGDHKLLEVGREIAIINPLLIFSTGATLRYEQQVCSISIKARWDEVLLLQDPVFGAAICIHLAESISRKFVRIRPDLAAGHSCLLDPNSKALKASIEKFDARVILKELLFEFPMSSRKNLVKLVGMEMPCIHKDRVHKKSSPSIPMKKDPAGPTHQEGLSNPLAEIVSISQAESRKRSFIEDAISKTKAAPVLGRNWMQNK
ncbi:hypothetical protein DI09_4p420 [Mitosporidium daphniae]|uniref:Uncharacterized protein n=1 Tax=Mitosporidium daphniae TaxID=1485682 RepID=A0A098VQ94_9MICR|nr:uncharacterized protein DI09_4p420 [Mitosporidium daphniae]KGG50959.1 hypothetical protein DI09_4p420 [Mitosporidium daphniae]|eukprot:XP_013237386.1 uncharacterized protein DI09_4p420 [Mitosporidium daphniae]